VTSDPRRPALTACSLCAGETLEGVDPLEGGQAARLRGLAARGVAPVTWVECLDECERGDVVVARPSRAARAAAHGPVWFERLAGDDATAHLEGWLERGGPGTELPDALVPLRLDRGGVPVPGEPDPA
jgi:(2Fe-2S) ferredoxin